MMNQDSTKRRSGRPKSPATDGGKVQQTFRAKAKTDELIRSSAEANRRSISEELEYRVESSLDGFVINKINSSIISKLADAAKLNCRNMEKEIEKRLENSFFVEDILGRSDIFSLLMLIAVDIRSHEVETGKTWKEAMKDRDNDFPTVIPRMVEVRLNQEQERYELMSEWLRHKKDDMENMSTFRP